MYRQSNDQYPEGQASNSYVPHHSMPKLHSHVENSYNPNIPPPLYFENTQPPPFEFMQQNNNPVESYDNRYPQWREVSQPKNHLLMPNIPPPIPISHYDRPPMHEGYQMKPMSSIVQDSFSQPSANTMPQVNIVQRISTIIKPQLSFLKAIMMFADKKTYEQRIKRERERSRSKSRDRGDRDRQRGRKNSRDSTEWTCHKCSFFNFDFRDRCKRCNQARSENHQKASSTKNFTPNPDDWRCSKCNNINYARRTECHRCFQPKNK